MRENCLMMMSPIRFSSVNGNRYGVHYIPNDPKPTLQEFKDTLETTVGNIAGQNGLKAIITYDEPTAGWTIFAKDGKIIPHQVKPLTVPDIDFAMVQFLDPELKNDEPAHNEAVTQQLIQAERAFQDKMFETGIFHPDGPFSNANTFLTLWLTQKMANAKVQAMRMVDTVRRVAYMETQGNAPS